MAPSPLAARLHAEGRLGKKSQRGVYAYAGRNRKPDPEAWRRLRSGAAAAGDVGDDAVVVDRLLLRMIDEATRCLEDGLVRDPADIDLALVYGIGFPPFRGGLLQYAQTRGLVSLVDRCRELEARSGARFAPSDRLIRMAASGERFFPDARDVARGSRMERP
jgi:3-hydroxyacyl-CoA dehydrogenase